MIALARTVLGNGCICGGTVRNGKQSVLQWRKEVNWQGRSGGNDRLL